MQTLAQRLQAARAGLGYSQAQAAVDAHVAIETFAAAENGTKNLRQLTVQRLEKWLDSAERRLERRVPRP